MLNINFKDNWSGKAQLRDAVLWYFLVGNCVVFLGTVFISRIYLRFVAHTSLSQTGNAVKYCMIFLCLLYLLGSLKIIWYCAKNHHYQKVVRITKSLFFLLAALLIILSIEIYFKSQGYLVTEITLNGEITPPMFSEFQNILNRSWIRPSKIKVTSQGGSGETALAIGMLIRDLNMDVEVVYYCGSSCANFIFPAGKHKYISSDAMILYHGGARQKNLIEQAKVADKAIKSGISMPNDNVFGVLEKEGVLLPSESFQKDAQEIVRKYIGIANNTSTEAVVERMIVLEDEFYKSLNVDPRIAVYGQEGRYLNTYQSYKYDGFYYSLETLDKLGVKNISVINGPWDVSKNELFRRVYEVVLPNN